MPPLAVGAAAVGLGALGAIAGAQKDVSNTSATNWVDVGKESDFEKYLADRQGSDFRSLSQIVDQGPGASDVSASTGASRDLAALLKSYSETGGLPSDSDVLNANKFANSIFAAREEALNQDFTRQMTDANRQAAAMGRDINDPILTAKLRQGQNDQSAILAKEKMGYASELGLGMADRRINYASQGANVLGNLAYQAMQNRAAILGLGQNLQGSERQWRLETGKRYQTGQSESGGGLKGALGGFIGGAGTALGAASMFGGGGGLGAMAGGGKGIVSGGGGMGSSMGSPNLGNGNYNFLK